jgi:hypothetical protein
MPSPNFTFSRFIDLLLVKLYELDQVEGDSFYDLEGIAREIRESVPQKWVLDAAKVLESRGLAACVITYGGVQAQITGEGRLYFEEERGTTKDIREHRDNYYITVHGDNNQVGVQATQTITIKQERALSTKLIKDMKTAIQSDQSLNESKKDEADKYLDVVEAEIKKPEPNRNILAAILEPLSKIASIAGKVSTLIQIING